MSEAINSQPGVLPTYAQTDDLESKKQMEINEEYKLWKKNAPFLYDLVITTSFEWPSLTCQWFPDVEVPEGKDYTVQRLLTGTNTSNSDKDYVQIANVLLPKNLDVEQDGSKEGGYGGAKPRVSIAHRINHEGEVNRARYMPQKLDIIASFSSTGKVFIFDRTRHPLSPPEDGICRPEIELSGHTQEGFAMSWNTKKEGQLITGSGDKTICLWDISGWTKGQNKMEPVTTYKGHTDYVADVTWHPFEEKIFGSVGDDNKLIIWDIRKDNPIVASIKAHGSNVNCIAFNPFNETTFVTGSADKTIALWDMRNLSRKLHSLVSHEDEVRSLAWSPTEPSILASSGLDRRVLLWDISKIGEFQNEEDAADGPPELLFLHGGHTDLISDIAWNPNRPWTMCSVAEDNVCQIWEVGRNVYNLEEEEGDNNKENRKRQREDSGDEKENDEENGKDQEKMESDNESDEKSVSNKNEMED
ncbi:putative histone-binding protein rbbD [Neoconidiobolus thromboides FSU 785]|nr:putative histone-binding protein rbbD [Neoconidiobolus thromboides FSU 785]